ncbi:MAG: hypothetical protein J1F42_00060 [Lachnospiraceae bacterium]|nr:hypothetical protein [Lachnospiraceae bacterium]
MKMRRCQIIRCTAIIAAAMLAVFSIYPINAFAVESITLPVQVMDDDVVSISIPVTGESETSVFDFILDPQGLLYQTDAVRYGGGRVEEGATLLFRNEEGEYDFSKRSDWLTVTNRSTVPVRVTVTARITDFGDIRLAESDDFGESTEPEVYLAIEDDQGNILPLAADEPATLNLEMASAPENTYVFRLDEENHTYQYGMSMDPSLIDFDTYSFGLIGACNSNAEWQNISVHPTITVTWYVEPIIPEEEEEISEGVVVEGTNGSTTDDIEENVPVDKPADKSKDEGEDDVNGDLDDKEQDKGTVGDGSDDEEQSGSESDNDYDMNNPDDTLEDNNEQNEDGGGETAG